MTRIWNRADNNWVWTKKKIQQQRHKKALFFTTEVLVSLVCTFTQCVKNVFSNHFGISGLPEDLAFAQQAVAIFWFFQCLKQVSPLDKCCSSASLWCSLSFLGDVFFYLWQYIKVIDCSFRTHMTIICCCTLLVQSKNDHDHIPYNVRLCYQSDVWRRKTTSLN